MSTETTTTVTSIKSGAVLQVIAWPEDAEAEDMVGKLWVRDANGAEFSIREKFTTPGGEVEQKVEQGESAEERVARIRRENLVLGAENERQIRNENRRERYRVTGR